MEANDADSRRRRYRELLHNITMDKDGSQSKLPQDDDSILPAGFVDKGADDLTGDLAATFKQPPPERPETVRTRLWVLLSAWMIAIFLGLPLWHATTTIYRAPLPMQEMQNWSEGKLCKTEFPLLVEVEAPSLPDAENLLKTVQHALDDANDFAAHKPHHLRLRLAAKKAESEEDSKSDRDENVACLLRLIPDSQNGYNHIVQSSSRIVDIHYPPPSSSSQSSVSAGLSKFVAETLEVLFRQEQELIEHLLLPQTSNPGSLNAISSQSADEGRDKKTPPKPRAATADITRRMSRVVKYSSSYHITFSLFTATSLPASWDIESAISQYLTPLLSALSPISNFTISTQVQYYASMSSGITPSYDGQSQSWTLKKEDLSSFINSAEWPLASISNDPNLNFILYIPHPSVSPLTIPSASHSNSFLLPQWGGVTILNLGHSASGLEHLSNPTLKPVLETFATHLLALLGAPPHPASLPIRLDSLTRQRSAEVLVSASSTLGSLQRLVNALPSISIPTTVSDSVQDSIRHLSLACEELRKGSFVKALEMGRVAQEEAEKAFFERTMVAQVYFPDEHKLAVYLPLLGPVSVPLVLGVFREVKRVIAERKRLRGGA
ncbi:GPI transamidase component [Orbilia oligospora]|uniref:GPI transamidase component n=1 Tax=Orbilia oligospora TaxID=2813651 RepID=A0A7C8IW81_ORBOL|nr:GPI transamidase component [Orbilia oligospora]KAF3092336.1 GPI transamidase component [Orbilia oligospora]KAF3147536.1 GPI transamidase component [Orbilia oligospora]